MSPDRFTWLLLGFFAWQFFHFQKQNLGMDALAGVSAGVGSVRPGERHALVAVGLCGIIGLTAHPELLQLGVDPRPLTPTCHRPSRRATAVATRQRERWWVGD